MSTIHYSIPLTLSKILEGKELPNTNQVDSISKMLQLIITTKFGEHRFDNSFGCEIWDLDFELIVSERMWEEKLRQSLLQSITTHEQRLSNIELTVAIKEIEKFHLIKQCNEIRKRVDIVIHGTIHKTGESFKYGTNMFLSPLSVD